jgi:hypothetical protein
MQPRRIAKFLLASAACFLLASPAVAVPIVFQIESGTADGFGFSSLHDADDNSPMSGASLGSLSGTLTLDYDGADTYSFLASSVTLASAIYVFEITGGVLQSDGAGFLDFALTGAGPFAHTGSILYTGGTPVCCGADGPNWVTPTALRLWGASNIAPSGDVAGVPKRIGMDLGGSASPVPEPSAALLFGAGMVVLRGALLGRRC